LILVFKVVVAEQVESLRLILHHLCSFNKYIKR
jgi:hypothetical protein